MKRHLKIKRFVGDLETQVNEFLETIDPDMVRDIKYAGDVYKSVLIIYEVVINK